MCEAAAEASSGSASPHDSAWLERYSRQIGFARIGERGQAKLGETAVLVAGAGALGASIAQHLVRAGVGLVRIVDRDFVELSNLQRQALYDEDDVRDALPKAIAAANKLGRINGGVRIEAHVADITRETVMPLLSGVNAVLDGTDNAATRFLLNEACARKGIPLIYGGASGSGGMTASFIPGRSACLRCLIGGDLHGGDGATCASEGILSPAVEVIASLQAMEALKWLSGNRDDVRSTWLSVELWPFQVREWRMPASDPHCPVCGGGAEAAIHHSGREEPWQAVTLCGRETVQIRLGSPTDLKSAAEFLALSGCRLTENPYLVRAELPDGCRLVLFSDGRTLVQGTSDPGEALRLCKAYVQPMEGVNNIGRQS